MKKKALIGIVAGVLALILIVVAVLVAPKMLCKHDDPTQIVTIEGKTATCQENGLSAGKKCNLCGTVIVTQEIVEKTGCLYYTLKDDGTYFVSSKSFYCTHNELVIPKTYNNIAVTSIGDRAFLGSESLTSVEIPDSVTSIADYAFYECTSLASITFAGTVEQWNSIEKGEWWNQEVPASEVVCSDGTVPLK